MEFTIAILILLVGILFFRILGLFRELESAYKKADHWHEEYLKIKLKE